MSTERQTGGHAGIDAYAPAEIARLVESVGVHKARLPVLDTVILGLLAGVFIAFGAMYFTLTVTGTGPGTGLALGPGRVLGGIAFLLGLVLVVIAGAELFTGNNLIVMAWADGKITLAQLLRNWALVFTANLVGAVGTAVAVELSGALHLGDGAVQATAIAIATAKVELGFGAAFLRGVLANALVCLAIWLSFAAHSVSGKILAIVFPISAFVALGFEHSIANMYLIPVAMLAGADGISIADFLGNLVPVTIGNIVGGSGFVALVYWSVYLRRRTD